MIRFSDLLAAESTALAGDRGRVCGHIYALCSSDGVVRYIGKTSRDPRTRLKEHLYEARGGCLCRKCRWIREAEVGTIYTTTLDNVREYDSDLQIDAFEYMYIKRFRRLNLDHGQQPLTNIFAGSWELEDAMKAGWLSKFPRKGYVPSGEGISDIRVSRMSKEEIDRAIVEIDEAYTLSNDLTNKIGRGPNSAEHNLAISETMKSLPPFGAHTRWHTNRSVVNDNCTLCVKEM